MNYFIHQEKDADKWEKTVLIVKYSYHQSLNRSINSCMYQFDEARRTCYTRLIMKVYFTASVSAKDKLIGHYQAIVNYLKTQGHSVVADHILRSSESEIMTLTRADRIKFLSQLEKWIKASDFVIAETSFPSISVGYEIAIALRVGKPVLVMYSTGDPPSLLGQHADDKLVCEKYSKETVAKVIEEFIAYIEDKTDIRFNFFITPHIIGYLDEVAKKQKQPRSVYLRKLIEKDMKEKGYS